MGLGADGDLGHTLGSVLKEMEEEAKGRMETQE